MKSYISKMLVMSLLITAVISGCSVHTREHNRRAPRHGRNQQNDRNDRHDDRRGDHYERHY